MIHVGERYLETDKTLADELEALVETCERLRRRCTNPVNRGAIDVARWALELTLARLDERDPQLTGKWRDPADALTLFHRALVQAPGLR
jgi:hypothetical protein